MLLRRCWREKGLKNVFSMEGGIRAWEGGVAEGAPEAGTAYFTAAGRPEEFIALAWMLEEGSRRFYTAVQALVDDVETKKLFRILPLPRNITRPRWSASTGLLPVRNRDRISRDRLSRLKQPEI